MDVVTNLYVSLSNTLFYSKQICSVITTSSGFPTATTMLGHYQIQHCHGKAPLVNEFAAEHGWIRFVRL